MTIPDVERIVSTALRANTAVAAIVADRVYTILPKDESLRVFPLCRLVRIGGGPVGNPAVLDAALLQLDVWADTQRAARDLSAALVQAIDELAGYSAHGGYVTGTSPATIRHLPDDSFTPTKPRYVLEVVVYARSTS